MSFEDISIFLKPTIHAFNAFSADSVGSKVLFWENKGLIETSFKSNLVILGVQEDRGNALNSGSAQAPDKIREHLYALKLAGYESLIIDLGNISAGFAIDDTYFAVSKVTQFLLRQGAVLVVLGGSQDLTYPLFQAYEQMEQIVNIATVDPRFDIGEIEAQTDSANFIGKIISHQPNYLFNFSNLAYQSYFVDQKSIELLNKLNFDAFRLGELSENIEDAEPILRNADLVSFDISSIRFSDAPGSLQTTPNGLNGEEACRVARYSGISDKLSIFGIFELNPTVDNRNQTSFLAAEMVWYFLNGYYNRIGDYPVVDKKSYKLFSVPISDGKYTIDFYKSNKSDRWWMEIPYPSKPDSKYERHYMVSCSYSDYLIACDGEIPDRWWKSYQKLQ